MPSSAAPAILPVDRCQERVNDFAHHIAPEHDLRERHHLAQATHAQRIHGAASAGARRWSIVIRRCRLIRACAAIGLPVIAIGGVTAERVPELVAAGAYGVAAIRALWGGEDPARAAMEMLELLTANG